MKTAYSIMQEAVDTYHPVQIYVGFSGGTDSLATTHWVMTHYPNAKVFHINTGIGIERTRQFVRDTCAFYGWPLVEVHAKHDCGQDYEELVKQWGFPGPGHHTKMYNRLKERGIAKITRDAKTAWKDRVLFVGGIRKDESKRRSNYDDRVIQRQGARVWAMPIYYWTGTDKHRYIEEHGLPRNPVSDLLGMSGECLCGAYAHPGELELIRMVEPETAERIECLEREVKACGHRWGWEGKPPKSKEYDPQLRGVVEEEQQFMCTDCNKRGRGEGE